MSFLLKIHYLVALFAAKSMPHEGKCCECLHKVEEDVVGFGDGEFLTDLSQSYGGFVCILYNWRVH